VRLRAVSCLPVKLAGWGVREIYEGWHAYFAVSSLLLPVELRGRKKPRMFTQQGEKLKDPNSRLIFKFIIFFHKPISGFEPDFRDLLLACRRRDLCSKHRLEAVLSTAFFIYC
jgi:hypothetical protein